MSFVSTFLFLAGLAVAAPSEDYLIGPGDVLTISISNHDFGQNAFPVSATGEVSFPHLGKVELSGRTTFQAEEAMRAALMDGYLNDPQVMVRVQEFRSQPVEVLGAIAQPGVYYMDGPTTVRSILSEAGGVESEKSTGRVIVTAANGEPVLNISLVELEGILGDFALPASSVVRVDEGRQVFVAGEVAKPGAVMFVDGITVMEALLQAGGSTAVARLSGAYVLRDGEKLQVNLRRVMKGKSADVTLLAGDRIVIPESPL